MNIIILIPHYYRSDNSVKSDGIKITQKCNSLIHLSLMNSQESPHLLWFLTAAPLSDVLGGSPVVARGLSCMVGGI